MENSSSENINDSTRKNQNDKDKSDFKKLEAKFVQLPIDSEFEPDENIKKGEEQKDLFKRKHGYAPDEDPEKARLRLELRRIHGRIKSDEDTRKMRRRFAQRIFYVSSAWLSGVFIILLLQGFHCQGFYLSDTVLTALIGATGGIGLLAIILRNLFPNEEKKPE
ncbi:MAG: hypothetical protein IT211_14990 [Armatimonadetes bacterium]|nr:hypothetical protein [Armatimonadota bacterium]